MYNETMKTRLVQGTASAADWPARRAELLALFREHVYGTCPEPDYTTTSSVMTHEVLSSEPALGGLAIRREIRLTLTGPSPGATHSWVVLLYLPRASSSGTVPCFIGLNFSGNHTIHADPEITAGPLRNLPPACDLRVQVSTE